jgi:hypothetical protein
LGGSSLLTKNQPLAKGYTGRVPGAAVISDLRQSLPVVQDYSPGMDEYKKSIDLKELESA